MKRSLNLLIFSLSFLVILVFSFKVRAEGSKEIYITTHNTYLFSCNDSVLKCDNGGPRTRFASYDGPEADRMYFMAVNPSETIYMGFNGSLTTQPNANAHIVFRIKDISGNIVYPETAMPTTGTGFIANIAAARGGPNQIYTTGGYNAINFHPPYTGTFYIEFTRKLNSNGSVNLGGIALNLFDITIYDTVAASVKPGRLYSKSWQFQESGNCSSTTYIYSVDSITTSCAFNNMTGGIWVQFCNQWGCQNTGNFEVDRKSRTTQSLLPQFKIFLNPPDVTLFPAATTLGQVVPPQPYGIQDCNSGNIVFHVNVDKPGNVEIELSFGGLYITRILNQTVVLGENQIIWDGLDGTLPTGVAVPNNVIVTFTVKYINGLTNLPFFDVEANPNGFVIGIVSPPGTTPNVYWDDTNISGGGSNLTGCLSPPGCHTWSNSGGGFGNLRTLNTWWYNVSASTTPVDIAEWRSPQALSFVQQSPSFCGNSSGNYLSVTIEPNTEEYHFSYNPPAGVTITHTNPGDNFVTLAFGPGAVSGTLEVYGTNFNCATIVGPTTSIAITVNPVPELSTPLAQNTCSGYPFSINLTSNPQPPSTTYSWSVVSGGCTANIQTCPVGVFSGSQINGNLSVTDLYPGTVTYNVTPAAGTCTGETKPIVVTVAAKPNISSPSGTSENLCTGGTTDISLQSLAFPTAIINWEVAPGGCANILNCPTSGTGGPIANQLDLLDPLLPGSVVYTITPGIGGCLGDPKPYAVNVLPLPPVTLDPFSPVCLNTPPFAIAGGSFHPLGVYTLDGNPNPITIFDPVAAGVGIHNITYTYTDGDGCTDSAQETINVQSLIRPIITGDTTACLGVAKTFRTDTAMVLSSYQWISPNGNIQTGANPWEVNITWATTTGNQTVTVTYSDPNGCLTLLGTKQVLVNSLPTPTIDATGNFNVCYGRSYTYATQPGKSNYNWNISPGNTITFINHTATVTWKIISGNEWIEVNYFDANGCTAAAPYRKAVVVNPSPVFNITGSASVCAGSTGIIYHLPVNETGNWAIASGGIITTPVFNVNSISVNWNSSIIPGQSSISVNYTNSLGCAGFTITSVGIQPQPVTTFSTTTPSPVCQDFPTPSLYTADPGGAAASYSWQVTPAALAHIANPSSNPAYITWKLSGNAPETALIQLSATTTNTNPACTSTSNPAAVTINPKPKTQLLTCFDQITTLNAKPFLLKGGTPLGTTGHFYIDQKTGTPVTWFNQASVGMGLHKIFYGYTNNNGCIAFDSTQITVLPVTNLSCNSQFTDPRDGNKYYAVLIGSQCWMRENLRYGTPLEPQSKPQTDNCLNEKYCLSSDPNCTAYGGLYQWDELLAYGATSQNQGLCPPGWHVPTESELQTMINTISTGMTPPADGIAGSFVKDTIRSPGFYALTKGIYYINNSWAFTSGILTGTMYWTSTFSGADRAIARGVNLINPSTSKYSGSRGNAFSARCLKD